jgi:hypothetical protein
MPTIMILYGPSQKVTGLNPDEVKAFLSIYQILPFAL